MLAIQLACLAGISACSSSSDKFPAGNDPGTIPTMLGDLTSTVYSSNEFELFWTASTDDGWMMGYDIFRDDTPIANLLDASSFFEDTLAPSTTYLYRVASVDDDANRSRSVELFVTTGDSRGGSSSAQVITAEPTMTPVAVKSLRFSWTISLMLPTTSY